MQVYMYVSIQMCKYAGIQICKKKRCEYKIFKLAQNKRTSKSQQIFKQDMNTICRQNIKQCPLELKDMENPPYHIWLICWMNTMQVRNKWTHYDQIRRILVRNGL